MNTIILGNLGYIGSLLTEHLIQLGHKVIGIDNCLYKQNHIAELFTNRWRPDQYRQYNLDVTNDYNEVLRLIKNQDAIIPLCALVGPICNKYPNLAKKLNLDFIDFLVKNISPNQILIYPDTNSGLSNSIDGFADENSPMEPCSIYGKLKYLGEIIALQHPNSIAFRFATLTGISYRTRLDLLVATICYEAFFNKKVELFESEFSRNYLVVQDAVRVFAFGLDNIDRMKQNVFNVGLDEANSTKRQLCQLIQKYIPHELIETDFQDPDKRDYKVSSAKIRQLGFKPQYSLDEGIQDLISWFKTLPIDSLDREAYIKYNRNTSI